MMKRLTVGFQLLWRERWNAVIGGVGFGVLVLIEQWIEWMMK